MVNGAAKLVKSGQTIKYWSKERGLFAKILIFLDVSAKLDYRIENGLFRKLIQILFGDNLSDIFK